MDSLFNIILGLHILGGTVGLLSGTIVMFRKKGDQVHKSIGSLFYMGILTAGFSALALSMLHPGHFLFIVGVFTVYMTATGKRYLLFYRRVQDSPQLYDWVLTILMLITACIFVIMGAVRLIGKDTFGLVFMVFGLLAARFTFNDLKNYRNKTHTVNWLAGHLQKMTGSYIASLTAFLVVNGDHLPAFVPSFIVWILPTMVLLPLIITWTKKYQTAKR